MASGSSRTSGQRPRAWVPLLDGTLKGLRTGRLPSLANSLAISMLANVSSVSGASSGAAGRWFRCPEEQRTAPARRQVQRCSERRPRPRRKPLSCRSPYRADRCSPSSPEDGHRGHGWRQCRGANRWLGLPCQCPRRRKAGRHDVAWMVGATSCGAVGGDGTAHRIGAARPPCRPPHRTFRATMGI